MSAAGTSISSVDPRGGATERVLPPPPAGRRSGEIVAGILLVVLGGLWATAWAVVAVVAWSWESVWGGEGDPSAWGFVVAAVAVGLAGMVFGGGLLAGRARRARLLGTGGDAAARPSGLALFARRTGVVAAAVLLAALAVGIVAAGLLLLLATA